MLSTCALRLRHFTLHPNHYNGLFAMGLFGTSNFSMAMPPMLFDNQFFCHMHILSEGARQRPATFHIYNNKGVNLLQRFMSTQKKTRLWEGDNKLHATQLQLIKHI